MSDIKGEEGWDNIGPMEIRVSPKRGRTLEMSANGKTVFVTNINLVDDINFKSVIVAVMNKLDMM